MTTKSFVNRNISSLGQMALESTTCGIVHHARRTRAQCPTMVLNPNSKPWSGSELGFGVRDAQCLRWYSLVPSVPNSIYYSIWSYGVRDAQCRSYQCSLALGRNHKSYIYLFLYDQLCN